MTRILILLNLLIAIPGLTQRFDLEIDSVIAVEIKEKQSRNVRQIGYTKVACVNYGISATAYLIWTEGNTTYIQKFDDPDYDDPGVHRFQPIVFIDSVFFPFYRINRSSLNSENVKMFQTTSLATVRSSHSCFRNFRLYDGHATLDLHFNFFDLDEFTGEPVDNSKLSKETIALRRAQGWEVDTTYKYTPERNINYEVNSKLKIAEWDRVISKCIDQIESSGKLVEIQQR